MHQNAKSVWMDIQEIFAKVDGSKTLNLHKVVARLTQTNAFLSVYFSKFKKFIGSLKLLYRVLSVILLSQKSMCYI